MITLFKESQSHGKPWLIILLVLFSVIFAGSVFGGNEINYFEVSVGAIICGGLIALLVRDAWRRKNQKHIFLGIALEDALKDFISISDVTEAVVRNTLAGGTVSTQYTINIKVDSQWVGTLTPTNKKDFLSLREIFEVNCQNAKRTIVQL